MNGNGQSARNSSILRSSVIVCLAVLITLASTAPALSCPFCLAIEPTLAQRRESAAAVALGEAAGGAKDKSSQAYRLHTILKGPKNLKNAGSVNADLPAAKEGRLAILFATADDAKDRVDRWDWSTAFANEALLGYFAAAPDLREPQAKRLAYFQRYLEHADRDIARDAYLEFAHASYEDVLAVAEKFNFASVRGWLVSQRVPEERKGFYGLVLGMAKGDREKADNLALLKRLIVEDRSDFRAGFDGMLAGYLLLGGQSSLAEITRRYFSNAAAKHGDVRHAMSALRFYYQYGPSELRETAARGILPLIDRPEFAAAAIIDLARWEQWQAVERVAAIYKKPESDGPTRRAVLGFLASCPKPQAAAALEQLRKQDPDGVAAIEKSLLLPGSQ